MAMVRRAAAVRRFAHAGLAPRKQSAADDKRPRDDVLGGDFTASRRTAPLQLGALD
ncbi:hypothetical protein M622_06990 [Thauera terpenica 58Eu]|uniref:Uncharacterized protein n=1 Tax=Thauera terpenica 58Eu TaxID=1348657 RepID=T0AMD5_9RHOO|nr:hypothetical protein M622_06990 [Thauera terpenica 58Eu]